jgi:2,3-bisphosphoglycerate-dependent phosphoglycerate mutase
LHLYFVRHGESVANTTRTFSNRGFQHPLTPAGVAQAHALAEKLATRGISRVYSSPLQRAVETAEILSQALGAGVTITKALREWDVGVLEGTSHQTGWDMHRQVQEDWFVHKKLDKRIPEGESFIDIQARFVPFIDGLLRAEQNSDTGVVLVGHGGLYHAMLPVILNNIDYDLIARHPFANTAYAVAETRPGGLHCLEWCGIAMEKG